MSLAPTGKCSRASFGLDSLKLIFSCCRFIDGDPTNNEANGTLFEHEWLTNQYRFGGDVKGLANRLDYLQGMGIKGIYLAGSPFSKYIVIPVFAFQHALRPQERCSLSQVCTHLRQSQPAMEWGWVRALGLHTSGQTSWSDSRLAGTY